MRTLVFQHTHEENPGTLLDWFRSRHRTFDIHPWYRRATAPKPSDYDWLVVLGGPMNVDEETAYPWLRTEKEFLRTWLAANKPVLGICLGAQMLAQALGGRVSKNKEREIGFHEVRTSATHPAFRRWPASLAVYQYHEDTFSLPPNATLQASSPACANQAFAAGAKWVGLQFHPESTRAWIEGNGASIVKADGEKWVQTPAETAAVTGKFLAPMTAHFHDFLDDFLGSIF
jgi:GMP synthase-like glutamine amidotransferase